jgi:hypothetical protein
MVAPGSDDDLLRRAGQHVFLCGAGDVAEALCLANMRVGLAKIHYAEQELGLEPRACFVGTPDATVTRNTLRWAAGFGYGGLVCWDPELFVLDAQPNGCGMLVGALDGPPSEERVREAAARARSSRLTLEGVELSYDLGESNHFVDVLELEESLQPLEPAAPAHLFIIHSSGHEHRAASPFGPGLHLHRSEALRRLARRLDTPFGPLHLLQGEPARAFHRFCVAVQSFNARRRELYGRVLFGGHRVVSNWTHQGLRAPGELLLGAYHAGPGLYPLTLGPDLPVYLLRSRPSFSRDVLRRLGWEERASRLGLLDRLLRASLLPHGGGYCFPGLRQLRGVEIRGEQRCFELQPEAGGEPFIVEDVRSLAFAYRGEEVLQRLVELELGEPVARYRISFVTKD